MNKAKRLKKKYNARCIRQYKKKPKYRATLKRLIHEHQSGKYMVCGVWDTFVTFHLIPEMLYTCEPFLFPKLGEGSDSTDSDSKFNAEVGECYDKEAYLNFIKEE